MDQLKAGGFDTDKVLNTSLSAPDAAEKALKVFEEAGAAGEKVLVHCSGGVMRTGTVCAFYLANKYQLPAEVSATASCALFFQAVIARVPTTVLVLCVRARFVAFVVHGLSGLVPQRRCLRAPCLAHSCTEALRS
jgi:hypothetical protein